MKRLIFSGRRRHSRRAFCAQVESMEQLCLLSDFTMISVTQANGRTVSFDYQVQQANISSLEVDFYRSATPAFSASADVRIGSTTLSGSELTEGTHNDVTAVLNAPLPSGAAPLSLDPAHPYVFAVAQGPDNVTTDAFYQTFIVAAVTHGLVVPPSLSNATPAWVSEMASLLQADGFNKVFAFSWTKTSSLPIANQATNAGNLMAKNIEKFIQKSGDVPSGAVVDLQLIGHSRGSVVITRAMQDLQNDLNKIPQAAGGYWLLTYLDPHPAHASNIVNFSVANNVAGSAALKAGNFLQRRTKDPYPLRIPSHVTEVQDYYENTAAALTPSLSTERVLNPWGTFPPGGFKLDASTTVLHVLNLTTPGIGHSEVHEWYQDNVVPLLSTAAPFVTGPIDAPISATSTTLSLGLGYHELIVDLSDLDPTSTSSDFTATVNWGDGSSSPETFTGNLIGYFIHDHHYYAGNGPYTYMVTIKDVGGATTTTSGVIT